MLAAKLARRVSTSSRLRLEPLESRQLLAGDLLITEVTAINRHSLLDLDGYASDWFEVHNPMPDPISLLGYSVTNDPAIPDKWSFSDGTLDSGDYLVVFASEKDRSGGDIRVRLTRDYHATPDGTFLVDLPNGTYDVRLTMGDTDRVRDNMDVYIQGVLVDTLTTQVGEIAEKTYMTLVDAGQLAIRLVDTGGETGRAVINGLAITPVDGGGEEKRFDFGPPEFLELHADDTRITTPDPELIAPVEPGHIPVSTSDTYLAAVGYGWQAGTVVSQQDRGGTDGEQHTNFQLSSQGDYLALTFGGMVVSEFAANGGDFPQQFTDVSYGIVGNTPGSEAHYFVEPTPGAANDAAAVAIGFVDDTTFSIDRGFYDAPLNVEITTSTLGASIAYTTDGTEPTLQNGTIIAAPDAQTPPTAMVLIDKTTVLRAAAFRDNYVPTNIDAQTYLFVDDILLQDAQATRAAGFPSSWKGTSPDYGMDPDVIGQNGRDLFGGLYAGTIRDDLKSIPTMSLVLDVDDMFGTEGIYSNPTKRGRAWERLVSVEYIDPAGGEDFQVEAGIRVQGNAHRLEGRNKKSFRLFFKDLYGAPKMEFPLFAAGATDRFDTITLRANWGDGWLWDQGTNAQSAHYARDEQVRRAQIAMGAPASHGTFVHLYINGIYWGLYNPVERPDDSFSASYFGGDKESWDALKHRSMDSPGEFEVTNGSIDAWDTLNSLARNLVSAGDEAGRTAIYQQMLGNHPDGSDNPEWETYLDVDNYISFLITQMYHGNVDCCGNNYYMARLQGPQSTGFKFFSWDSEGSLGLTTGPGIDRTSIASGSAVVYTRLRNSAEFRLRFADHVHRHLFNDGVLTTDASIARFEELAQTIDRAIVGESARWGDGYQNQPLTRARWVAEGDVIRNFLVQRTDIQLQQFRDADLYPGNDTPGFEIDGQPQRGGTIVPGAGLTLDDQEQAGATVYYTLTGVDPREIGGAISASALAFQPGVDAAITLNETTQVKARILDGSGQWSALSEALFAVAAPELRITELNYNPYDPTPAEVTAGFTNNDDFEFIELENVGPTTINLLGTRFSDGIEFTFPSMLLDAGERVVVVKNQDAFEARYAMGIHIAGEFTSSGLSNAGENLTLVGPDNITTILDFAYNDNDPWPERADGNGGTLELIDPIATPAEESGKYYHWRGSTEFGGSPGAAGSEPLGVVINEVLSNTDTPIPSDSIELYNPTVSTLDIGGLYLSDSAANFLKYQIPIGTMLGAGAYIVFDESDFNPSDGVDPNHFALSGAGGDDVWLTVSDGSGGITSFVDDVHFGAAPSGESFGRTPHGSRLAPMTSLTLGAANSVPRVGPLVVSEVHYHPLDPSPADLAIDPNLIDDDLEFVEVFNPTGDPVDLTDWRIRGGVDFDFDAGTMIAPGETLVVISFNPDAPANVNRLAAFRSHFGMDNSVRLLGGYADQLNNNGEKVKLLRPDDPTGMPLFIPRLLEDEVLYDDRNPWPTEADGTGKSLTRISATAYGNLSAGWTAGDPTPGSASFHVLGDMDLDDDVDCDDIDDFVVGLSDPVAYEVLFGVPATFHGDTDQDGDLDFDDIDDFLLLLSCGDSPQAGSAMNADGQVTDGDVGQLALGNVATNGLQATIHGDTDRDGDIDFDDIDDFLASLNTHAKVTDTLHVASKSSASPATGSTRRESTTLESVWSDSTEWLTELFTKRTH